MSLSLRRRLELELSAGRGVSAEEPALVHEARADDVEGGGEEAGAKFNRTFFAGVLA